MGRVSVCMSSFLRVEGAPIPDPHVILGLGSCGDGHLFPFSELWAFLESPHEGAASWSRTQPSHQPAAPLPAMQEHAAHIPVPTLPPHLKTN